MTSLTIDNKKVQVPEGTNLLEAARQAGIKVPSLCCLEDVQAPGSCRVCLVEVKGAKTLVPSCVTTAAEGVVVQTNSHRVRGARRTIVEVSVMPCTAKKYEALRPEMNSCGMQDVDMVLTTRELGRMIESAGIAFGSLEDGKMDSILGESTGAADIFANTGGVMEAALGEKSHHLLHTTYTVRERA